MEESYILQGMRENNIVCYEKLIDRYSSYIVRVVMKVAGNRLSKEDVEEFCADVLVKIWEDRQRLTIGEGKLKAYIGSMARNRTLNCLRTKGKCELVPLEEDVIEYETPESNLMKDEDAKFINEVVSTLPEPDREIFIRRYFYMEKVIDIARTLGINTQTVGTKLFRGKKKLEKALSERGVAYE